MILSFYSIGLLHYWYLNFILNFLSSRLTAWILNLKITDRERNIGHPVPNKNHNKKFDQYFVYRVSEVDKQGFVIWFDLIDFKKALVEKRLYKRPLTGVPCSGPEFWDILYQKIDRWIDRYYIHTYIISHSSEINMATVILMLRG